LYKLYKTLTNVAETQMSATIASKLQIKLAIAFWKLTKYYTISPNFEAKVFIIQNIWYFEVDAPTFNKSPTPCYSRTCWSLIKTPNLWCHTFLDSSLHYLSLLKKLASEIIYYGVYSLLKLELLELVAVLHPFTSKPTSFTS
jgi:hypothetical protein